jgi:hypothetical protein
MKILVIGARGFFGSRVAGALRKKSESRSGVEVVANDRSIVDLTKPETFAAIGRFDVIVNASDAGKSSPLGAIDHVLAHGGVWVECTGETEVIEAILERRGKAGVKGVVLCGAGIFPGMSSVIARQAIEAAGSGAKDVKIGIRVTPMAGAGKGMCAQMGRMIIADTKWIEGGAWKHVARPFSGSAVLPFESGAHGALRLHLPETAMLRASTGIDDIATYIAPRPSVLLPMFRMMAALTPPWRWAKAMMATVMTWVFVVQRAVLLRKVSARTELVAVCGNAVKTILVEDGIAAGGDMAADAVMAIGQRAPGVYLPDEIAPQLADVVRISDGRGSRSAASASPM